MKIGILGTRGIPNYHGGFEQFAEYFSVFLQKNGHETYVYCSNKHPFKENIYKGVTLIHCNDPEDKIGTAGQFIYDYNCIKDARKRDFDILLQLGYTSNSIWHKLLPKKPIIITNMDGLEWKRSKYNKQVRQFLKYAESLAVKSSDYLIADSIGIKKYLENTYTTNSKYIPYGAVVFSDPKNEIIQEYSVPAYGYNMLIARIEPENSIETILDGVVKSNTNTPFLVIGKQDINKFGKYLTKKYRKHKNIRFLGGIYNQDHLNNLRYYSKLYFHGHTVGGTNPSLLEAMASQALIIAHNNEFNETILGKDAFYFSTSDEVSQLVTEIENKNDWNAYLEKNTSKIQNAYSWEKINNSYLEFMKDTYAQNT